MVDDGAIPLHRVSIFVLYGNGGLIVGYLHRIGIPAGAITSGHGGLRQAVDMARGNALKAHLAIRVGCGGDAGHLHAGFPIAAAVAALLRIVAQSKLRTRQRLAVAVHLPERKFRQITLHGGNGVVQGSVFGERGLSVVRLHHPVRQTGGAVGVVLSALSEACSLVL